MGEIELVEKFPNGNRRVRIDWVANKYFKIDVEPLYNIYYNLFNFVIYLFIISYKIAFKLIENCPTTNKCHYLNYLIFNITLFYY